MKSTSTMKLMAAFLAIALWAAPLQAADSYMLDKGHSSVHFKVQRGGAVFVVGRFNDIDGSAQWDSADPANNSLEMVIQTGSVDSGNDEQMNTARQCALARRNPGRPGRRPRVVSQFATKRYLCYNVFYESQPGLASVSWIQVGECWACS